MRRNPLTRDWADNTVVWLESSPYVNLRAVRKIIDELHEANTDAEFRGIRKKIERLFQTLEDKDQLVEGDDAAAITQALLEGTLGLAEHGIARPEHPRRAAVARPERPQHTGRFDDQLPPGYEAAVERYGPALHQLRVEAALAAGARGHNIEWSPPRAYVIDNSYTQVGGCIHCHREVLLNTRPPPNGIEISGEAVAMNCTATDEMTEEEEERLVDLSDLLGGDEITLMQGWYSGMGDPLYALQSSGTLELGRFGSAISNLESIIAQPHAEEDERGVAENLAHVLHEVRARTLFELRQRPQTLQHDDVGELPWFHQGYIKALVRDGDELLEVELPAEDADIDEYIALVNATLLEESRNDCNSFLTTARNYHDLSIVRNSTDTPPTDEDFGEAFWVVRNRFGGYDAFGAGLGPAVAAGRRLVDAAHDYGVVELTLDDEGRLQ